MKSNGLEVFISVLALLALVGAFISAVVNEPLQSLAFSVIVFAVCQSLRKATPDEK